MKYYKCDICRKGNITKTPCYKRVDNSITEYNLNDIVFTNGLDWVTYDICMHPTWRKISKYNIMLEMI